MPLSATLWLLRYLTVSAQALNAGLSTILGRIRLTYIQYTPIFWNIQHLPRALLHTTFSNRGGKHEAGQLPIHG
jgi:hypothetical protein